ncbi:M20/M25/M40 family metallo-hydrolase [Mycobacterium sp. NPDC003449]
MGSIDATSPRLEPTVELLQTLIRNRCVNTGHRDSGEEVRNADTLRQFLGNAVDTQVYDAAEGRRSIVAKIHGSDPKAPSLALICHTDVVPADDIDWLHDPFGGDLVDGMVWGRGAIDMLNMTATMAAAIRHAGECGHRPRGDISFIATADEEGQATWGAKYLLEHHLHDVATDYVVTEGGGWPLTSGPTPKLSWATAEKGTMWLRLIVHGRAGHAAMPFGADNALVKAATIVGLLDAHRPEPVMSETWTRWVRGMDFDPETTSGLLDASRVRDTADTLPELGGTAHACTHMTLTPTGARGGIAINSIPERVEIDVDARVMPGQTRLDVEREIRAALGRLADEVTIEWIHELVTHESPLETPLYDTVTGIVDNIAPGTQLVPSMITASTDADYFRRAGAQVYGFSMFSGFVGPSEFRHMFHGANERVDTTTLALSTELWTQLIDKF